MSAVFPAGPPALPLLLWGTPPGLEMILAQEGVAFEHVRGPHPLAFAAGRFVLFDGRRVPRWRVRGILGPDHVAIDVDALRRDDRGDPFAALLDTRAGHARWDVDGCTLIERVARRPRAAIRARLLGRLREAIVKAGGAWARLAPFPHPYRSAFHFRVDLDEYQPEDYARFARARWPLDDCTTHFVCTHAYGGDAAILDDLRRLDAQSHGHYHVVYRDQDANRRNLERAHAVLERAGITPTGFAAPGGRWNPGLDRALEGLGYAFSSDFQLGHDDLPFFPWRDGRFSRVLQVPIHPVCEGLFVESGVRDGRLIGAYLAATVRAKVASGEPAFVYGHPEGRLGRMPEVLAAVAEAVACEGLVWRTTLTEFAAWWRWRQRRRWSLVPKGGGRYEVQFDDWDGRYPLALEIRRGTHVASVPIVGPRTTLRLSDLAYERRRPRVERPEPTRVPSPRGLKAIVRAALDWETVTPVDELPDDSIAAVVKKRLRRWRGRRARRQGANPWA